MNYRYQNHLQMNIVWCSIVCVPLHESENRKWWDEKRETSFKMETTFKYQMELTICVGRSKSSQTTCNSISSNIRCPDLNKTYTEYRANIILQLLFNHEICTDLCDVNIWWRHETVYWREIWQIFHAKRKTVSNIYASCRKDEMKKKERWIQHLYSFYHESERPLLIICFPQLLTSFVEYLWPRVKRQWNLPPV